MLHTTSEFQSFKPDLQKKLEKVVESSKIAVGDDRSQRIQWIVKTAHFKKLKPDEKKRFRRALENVSPSKEARAKAFHRAVFQKTLARKMVAFVETKRQQVLDKVEEILT